MDHQATVPQQDRFFEQLASAAASVTALITAGYAWYFAFIRGPWLHQIALDFGIPLTWPSTVVLEWPWIPLVVAIVALLSGFMAFMLRLRAHLVCAFILTSLAVAITLAADIAAKWPVDQMARSITGLP